MSKASPEKLTDLSKVTVLEVRLSDSRFGTFFFFCYSHTGTNMLNTFRSVPDTQVEGPSIYTQLYLQLLHVLKLTLYIIHKAISSFFPACRLG